LPKRWFEEPHDRMWRVAFRFAESGAVAIFDQWVRPDREHRKAIEPGEPIIDRKDIPAGSVLLVPMGWIAPEEPPSEMPDVVRTWSKGRNPVRYKPLRAVWYRRSGTVGVQEVEFTEWGWLAVEVPTERRRKSPSR
jgi:hypothetical protein